MVARMSLTGWLLFNKWETVSADRPEVQNVPARRRPLLLLNHTMNRPNKHVAICAVVRFDQQPISPFSEADGDSCRFELLRMIEHSNLFAVQVDNSPIVQSPTATWPAGRCRS